MPHRLILGIESSCDETSAAVVRMDSSVSSPEFKVLSNVVASQLIHADYGGVVPELASREHLRAITPVVREAMHRAGLQYSDLEAIAVTAGPGLAGALLVGITFAKALAFAANKPLISVNHLEGHIHAVLMDTASNLSSQPESAQLGGPINLSSRPESAQLANAINLSSRPDPEPVEGEVKRPASPAVAPLLALVVSGGHTHLYLATRTPQQTWHYRNVGKTLDDAAGEAYDKVAKLLGLPYPGGPWIDALATHGAADPTLFPLTQIKQKATGNTAPKLSREAPLDPGDDPTRFDLSFSGLKTAVRRYVELHHLQPSIAARAEALRAANLTHGKPGNPQTLAAALTHFDTETLNLIASFQHAVVKNLTRSTFAAAGHFGAHGILVSGGVSANSELRTRMSAEATRRNLPIAFPTIALSTDNAAMIAAAAFPKLQTQTFAPATLEPTPQLRLG
jgi:N6-L-threonylcarbamoyladenine synthase